MIMNVTLAFMLADGTDDLFDIPSSNHRIKTVNSYIISDNIICKPYCFDVFSSGIELSDMLTRADGKRGRWKSIAAKY
jgi:hypothetical protein